MKKYRLLLLLPLLLAACKKEFTLPLPDAAYLPVLNTLINEDSLIYVRLTLSARPQNGMISGIFPEPDTAEVQLFEDGVYKETLQAIHVQVFDLDRKYYVSTTPAIKGRHYRIRASVPGYAAVEGEDLIPDRNDFAISDKHSFLATTGDGYPEMNLQFRLENRGAAKAYYRFSVYLYNNFSFVENGDTIHGLSKTLYPFYIKDERSNGSEDYNNLILREDPLGPGEAGLITLASASGGVESFDSFSVEVMTMTETAYKYLKSVQTARDHDGDPTAEKVIIYSNVQNGLGIVGGVSTREESFYKP